MPDRKDPGSFVCLGCHQTIQREPCPARDRRMMYCSLACKMRVFTDRSNGQRMQSCCGCGSSFTGYGREYCSDACRWVAVKLKASMRMKVANNKCLDCGVSVGLRLRCENCQKGHNKTLPSAYRQKLESICRDCGVRIPSIRGRRFCSICREVRHGHNKRRAKRHSGRCHGERHIARAKRLGVALETVSRIKVFERDGWKCQLCGVATPRELLKHSTDPCAPTLDHVIPMARGGGHTYDNTQCLCRSCNSRKGSRVVSTLMDIVYVTEKKQVHMIQ